MNILRKGNQGPEVQLLQTRLRAHGYPIEADGDFGSRTRAAVISFQSNHGLEADGIVGSATWEALETEPERIWVPKPEEPLVTGGLKIVLDPGHGQGNRKAGVYDSGAESNGVKEAVVALNWAKKLAAELVAKGHKVEFTRGDQSTPTSISSRTVRAKEAFGGTGADLLLSIHCNAANGSASGTETFYRQASSKAIAQRVNDALVAALSTKDRGVKTEASSQHPGGIHVLSYKPDSILVELGFIDHAGDREKLTSDEWVRKGCQAIAAVL